MTDAPLPQAPAPKPAASAPVDIRRLLLIVAVAVGGLVYFFWDDVRDVLQPPHIEQPAALPAAALAAENRVEAQAGRLHVTFTRIGAAIIGLTWTAPDGHVETIIGQDGVPNRALLLELPGREGSADRLFQVTGPTTANGVTEVVFEQADLDNGFRVRKTFRIDGEKPLIELTVQMENLPSNDVMRSRGYTLKIANAIGVPDDLKKDDPLITIRADRIADPRPVRRLSGMAAWPTKEEQKRAGHGSIEGWPTLEWVSTGSRYFAMIVRPDNALYGAELRFTRTAKAGAAVELQMPAASLAESSNTFHVYAGPKDYDTLATLPGRQQEAVNYWYLGRETTLLLRLIHDRLVPNYGVAIILVTILFRLLMWPVTWYNLRSLVDIRIANAKLAEIDAREPPRSDRAARIEWVKDARVWENLQRRATIGVFLPMLILLPVLLILYYTLDVGYDFYRQPLFLWIHDVSRRDPLFVLPVLMGLAMMGQMRTASDNPKKERSWIWMPAAFTVLFAFFSAGLVLFWLVDTLVSWGQLAAIKKRRVRGGKLPV